MVGRIIFPSTNYLLDRRAIIANYKHLLKSQWYKEDFLRELQRKKLHKILRYASLYIPYYKSKFEEIGLVPQDIKTLEDIKLIPPLSKQDVTDHYKEMVDIRLHSSIPAADNRAGIPGAPLAFARFRKHTLIKSTTSGSTGAPTIFYEDGVKSALNWAYELRLKNWYGLNPGAKEARLLRLSTGYSPRSMESRGRRWFWGQLILPGTNLSDEEYALCMDSINTFKPKVLWGVTSALTGLGEYVLKQGGSLGSYRPKVIIGWSDPLYPYDDEVLKSAFRCPVTSIYSSREIGHIAGMCPHGSFHINEENLFVESEKISTGANDCAGELLVTTLGVSPMPFIRYRMGDLGHVAGSTCSCGRSLHVLKNLLGRTGEIFISKEGRMIAPSFWGLLFMTAKISGAVKRFQIIYTKSKDIKIIIERAAGFSNETEKFIKEVVAKNFSKNTKLKLEYIPIIEPQLSGKYQMVINEEKIT
jgi:phenylacetate-CoA ligase